MPELQLPIFPAGVTDINNRISVQKEAGTVYYLHGHLPVFQHEGKDVRGFRMFTSQMIIDGTVKAKEIVQAFGLPMITVKRYVKLYRDRGSKGFYEAKPRHSSASVLKAEVLEQAQQLLDEGRRHCGYWRTHWTRRSVRAVCEVLKKSEGAAGEVTTKSERSQTDSQAPMGNGAKRSLERVAAAMGELESAPGKLDSQIRSKAGQRHRLAAQFGALALSEDPTEPEVQGFPQRKGNLLEQIQVLDLEFDTLQQLRKQTQHHIAVKSLPEADCFTRLHTDRKHFIDALKMITYRAASSMASLLREHMVRGDDDARALLRQIFQTEADLTPDLAANTLTIRLHPLTQVAHDQAVEQMLAALNDTQTLFPGTNLTLEFKLGSG